MPHSTAHNLGYGKIGNVLQNATLGRFAAKITNAKCYTVLQNATLNDWAQKMS